MGTRRSIPLMTWLLLLPAAVHAQADVDEGTADETLSPYFFLEGSPDGAEAFPLEATHVSANVSGVIADVTVEQVYRNDGTGPIEARYVFPASTRAAVHGLRIQVGDKAVVAKIKERDEAAEEFREAAEAGKTASLLEQSRPNVFTMAVSNVLPGDRVIVTLRYSELLVPKDGVYRFVYPTVVGPRYSDMPAAGAAAPDQFVRSPYMHQGEEPPMDFTMDVAVSTGIPLAQLGSESHPIDITWDGPSLAHVALKQGSGFGGDRDFILGYRLAGEQIQSGLLLYEGPRGKHFLLMVQPPKRVKPEQVPPREYIFVLDVSGSMSGFPLDTATELLRKLVTRLKPTDLFNVLLFAGDSNLLSPRSLPATRANVTRAVELITTVRGGGGTELQAALQRAMSLPRDEHVSRSVVLITDGYIAQERGAFELIAHNLNRTNVFAFGIGSSVNRFLIEGIARAGQGEPFIVTNPSMAPDAARRFREYIESPVLTDVKVRMHGFDAYDVEPLSQPDLFAERPIIVFGKWRGTPTGEIEVRGHGGEGPFTAKLSVAGVEPQAENAALPQLWARSRIARLSDWNFDGTDDEAKREVTSLGLTYSLLTEHTSFIAVLEEVRNHGKQARKVDQPLIMPAGVSDAAVGSYAGGDEPELVWMLLLLAAVAWVMHRRRAALLGVRQ